jgi:hypothetical protein
VITIDISLGMSIVSAVFACAGATVAVVAGADLVTRLHGGQKRA